MISLQSLRQESRGLFMVQEIAPHFLRDNLPGGCTARTRKGLPRSSIIIEEQGS